MAGKFEHLNGFDRIVQKALLSKLANSELWYPAFDTSEEAMGFGLYVAKYFRRVVEGLRTHVSAREDSQGLFLAECKVDFPGYGAEQGVIVCKGGSQSGAGGECEGIMLTGQGKLILLPIKQHSYCAVTDSGSKYLAFEDGSAFCRSASKPALQLLFTSSLTEADQVLDKGGDLLTTNPAHGTVPLYCYTPPAVSRGTLMHFKPGAFRRGTPVKAIYRA